MRRVLVLYDPASLRTSAVEHHLRGMTRGISGIEIYYASKDALLSTRLLNAFDVLIVHYSVRLAHPTSSPKRLWRNLSRAETPTFVFIQDEYENVETTRALLSQIRPAVVFTCVPPSTLEHVYPTRNFSAIRFIHVLTGYAPDPGNLDRFILPLSQRPVHVFYRGRELAYHYGRMAREKHMIAEVVRPLLATYKNLNIDIESSESMRVYGDDWYRRLASAKATLGTESGANIFDWDGSLRIAAATHKDLTFEEFEARFLRDLEREGAMNQVSPRIFEAAAVRTALILFEGQYSGVLRPNIDYFALKRDLSNSDELLALLSDDAALERLTQSAHANLIESGQFSWNALGSLVSEQLTLVWTEQDDRGFIGKGFPLFKPTWQIHAQPSRRELLTWRRIASATWIRLPLGLRLRLRPILIKTISVFTRRTLLLR